MFGIFRIRYNYAVILHQNNKARTANVHIFNQFCEGSQRNIYGSNTSYLAASVSHCTASANHGLAVCAAVGAGDIAFGGVCKSHAPPRALAGVVAARLGFANNRAVKHKCAFHIASINVGI